MAHTYSHLYGLPATDSGFSRCMALGAPDMAPMLFARAILAGEPIKVFNHGKMQRDFTYIDDIVEGCCVAVTSQQLLTRSLIRVSRPSYGGSTASGNNIGNSQPTELLRFIEVMNWPRQEAIKDYQPMQPGDVVTTAADTQALQEWVGFKPSTSIEEGIKNFVKWYMGYYCN